LFRTLKVLAAPLVSPTTPPNEIVGGLMVKLAGESTSTLNGRFWTLPLELQEMLSVAVPAFVLLKTKPKTQDCTTGTATVAAQVVVVGSGVMSGPLLRQARLFNGPAGVTETVNGTA
jgi:hypothetical protein